MGTVYYQNQPDMHCPTCGQRNVIVRKLEQVEPEQPELPPTEEVTYQCRNEACGWESPEPPPESPTLP